MQRAVLVALLALAVTSCGAHQGPQLSTVAATPSVERLPAQAGLPAGVAPPGTHPDVYAYIPENNAFTNDHPPGEGQLQLRSADTGRVLRTLVRSTPANPVSSPLVGSSGRFVYYSYADDPTAPLGTVSTPYRIPINGGSPQRLPLPTYDGTLQTAVYTVIAAPDDRRFAYLITADNPVDPTTNADGGYQLVVTEVGGATIDIPGTDPIGWADDNHLLVRDAPGATGSLVVRSIDVTDPNTATTVLDTTAEDPGNPGQCAGPNQFSDGAAITDVLVIDRSRCSGGLVTRIDLRTGAQSNVRLPAAYSAVYPGRVILTPAGSVVLPLTKRNQMEPDPIVAIHGTTVTRIGIGTG